ARRLRTRPQRSRGAASAHCPRAARCVGRLTRVYVDGVLRIVAPPPKPTDELLHRPARVAQFLVLASDPRGHRGGPLRQRRRRLGLPRNRIVPGVGAWTTWCPP